MKPKYHILISCLALACLIILADAKKTEVGRSIRWGERALTWDDFPLINNISGGYDAKVYSDIQFEGNRGENSLHIYARMLPHLSGRVVSEDEETDQLLIHEQHHFDITEYHARLFRKEVIGIGKKNLTNEDLQRLGKKYLAMIEKMQALYDMESKHNTAWIKQRYWELHIAGLLRETAFYTEEDIYHYQNFTDENTQWFRKVYVTLEGELLPSYPENEKNSIYGEVYKVEKKQDSIIVNYYKNGIAKAGGYFEAPVCIITFPNSTTREQHLFNEKGEYFTSETTVPISRILSDSEGNITRTYFDGAGKQVALKGIFIRKGEWNADQKSFYHSYYDENGKQTTHDGAFHELREMGENKVTWRISYFDKAGKPMRDDHFVSVYEYEINDQYSATRVKLLDVDGKYAISQDVASTVYDYDERGNIAATSYLGQSNNKVADFDGIHKYTYTYDLNDNVTDIRRYNLRDLATNGMEEFHQSVNLYDSLGRTSFTALYHPEYTLKFSDEKDGATVFEYLGDSIIKVKNVDVSGLETPNDLGISLTKKFLNPKKEVISEQFFNDEGYWAKTKNGVTSYNYKYDERGNQIEKAAFDSLGKRRAWNEDVAISRMEYDERNNNIKTTYFTAEDLLAETAQGATYRVFKYDDNNNLIESANFDRNMEPILFDGVFRTVSILNRFGLDSIIKMYGVNNQLIKGPSIIKYIHDYQGNREAEAFYDAKNNPILDETGIHKTVYNRDKYGRYIGYTNIGKNGEAINDHQGIGTMLLTLNPSGFVQSHSYFDKYQRPILGPDGFHRVENHYNDMDEIVRSSTYGPDQKLINNREGVADYVYQVSTSGQITRISFYDSDSNLTEDADGIAEYFYSPSLNGLFYLQKQLNAEGEEVPSADI